MQKHILVKTPLTIDGNMPLMKDGMQVYTESVLTEAARPILEKRNQTLLGPLKVLIESYAGEIGVLAPDDIIEAPVIKPVVKPTINKIT